MNATLTDAFRTQPALLPGAAFLASGALIAGAWAFELIGGLAPCELCLWQRWPHYAVMIVALNALLFAGGATGRRLGVMAFLFGLGWLAAAGIAGFHVGVEQQWWRGLEACGGGGIGANLSLEDLKAQILAAPVIRCDEVPWSLFGISLAGYNFLASAGLAIVAGLTGARLWSSDGEPA